MSKKIWPFNLFADLPERPAHLVRGKDSEDLALKFLLDKGLTLSCRNYRCKHGELDLVMRDGSALVVVEVRFRRSARYGSAAESITHAKRSRIIAATRTFLGQKKIDCPIRFDVIAILGDSGIEWIPNAFSAHD